jgi:hypothetical protein
MAATRVAAEPPAPHEASHIVMETTTEAVPQMRRPETVAAQFDLKSLFRGTRTQLTLYQEGLLVVRELGAGRRKELMLDLRYLDPRPTVSRTVAVRLLYHAGGAAGLAALLVALAGLEVFPAIACLIPAFALGLVAGVMTWCFLYQSGERAVFRTERGQADVLELIAGLGEIKALRGIVPAIVAAIRAAGEARGDYQLYLREEMREHYRLAETGVISEDECSTCTQRILHQFV